MIKSLKIYKTDSTDPYRNLAVEEYFLDSAEKGSCILYLWQNEKTVVIGKNQNAWKECRVSLLEEDGGHLTRRLSGGGAVYHDLGNLNFTFIASSEDYDLKRQLEVIQRSCALCGIETSVSGRNDILALGRKFSGNAFCSRGGNSYHHGTLMVDVDMTKAERYLSPSPAKLKAKSVDSVRSRTINLSELMPGLTIKTLASAMEQAFGEVYGLAADEAKIDEQRVALLTEKQRDPDWLYGIRMPFSAEFSSYLPVGELQLLLDVKEGCVAAAKVFSDSMDLELPCKIENALLGRRFERSELAAGIRAAGLDECIASLFNDI